MRYSPLLPNAPYPPPGTVSPGLSSPNPMDPKTWDYGYRREVTLIKSPPVGASFIAITLFFLISFTSNYFTTYTTLAALGLSITLSIIGFLILIVLILFLI